MRDNIPIYLFTGMLDSGKTTFVRGGFKSVPPDSSTLVLVCEQGEEEYPDPLPHDVHVIIVEDIEELTPKACMKLDKAYRPDQVFIELNGMWSIDEVLDRLPEHWLLFQCINLVDANTFAVYIQNMPEQMLEKIRYADMVIFNRCTDELAEVLRSRNLRLLNRRAALYLQYTGGQIKDYAEGGGDAFDMTADVIEIPDEDFGVFFVEILEQLDKYMGKRVRYTGLIQKDAELEPYFAAGRVVMSCCEDDMAYCGLACKSDQAGRYPDSSWVEVEAVVEKGEWALYEGEGPVLAVQAIGPAKAPAQETVSF